MEGEVKLGITLSCMQTLDWPCKQVAEDSKRELAQEERIEQSACGT
jgi:hypothetical protein